MQLGRQLLASLGGRHPNRRVYKTRPQQSYENRRRRGIASEHTLRSPLRGRGLRGCAAFDEVKV